ncbi:hypothetical protein EON66_11805, partial [archaeon]
MRSIGTRSSSTRHAFGWPERRELRALLARGCGMCACHSYPAVLLNTFADVYMLQAAYYDAWAASNVNVSASLRPLTHVMLALINE